MAKNDSFLKYLEILFSYEDPVVVTDNYWRIIFSNQAAQDFYGISPTESEDRAFHQLIVLERAPLSLSEIQAAVQSEKSWRGEAVHVDFAGQSVWVDWVIRTLRLPKKGPLGFISITRDISAKKFAEEAWRISEERYHQLFNQMHNGFLLGEVVLDANGAPQDMRVLGGNPAIERITGVKIADMIWKTPAEILPDVDLVTWKEKVTQVARTGEPVQFEWYNQTLDLFMEVSVYTPHPGLLAVIISDISAYQRAQRKIEQERQRMSVLLSSLNTGLSLINPDLTIAWVNEKIRKMFPGFDPIGQLCHVFYETPEGRCDDCSTMTVFQSGKIQEIEKYNPTLQRWYHIVSQPILNPAGQVINVLEGISDITERKRAEEQQDRLAEQLRLAAKMEAVGRLADGVAHDFNNILTSVVGYTEMLISKFDPEDPIHADLREIKNAADRASSLTQQLFAFSRRHIIRPKVIDLHQLIVHSQRMLGRLIGEDIKFVFHPAPGPALIKADHGQIEQMLVNLAINARDDMPRGGRLTLGTESLEPDPSFYRLHSDCVPGRYIKLIVSDDGQGLDRETKEHLFEPFYKAPDKDKSAGLGLGTVYGAIKQNGGCIEVDSELGRGLTFTIYLPAVEEEETDLERTSSEPLPTGSETVLLVEDEEMVRKLAYKILERQGYRVLEASHGGEALLMGKDYAGDIDLLLTDVVMPNMNGKDLYENLVAIKPDLKVLYMSGYAEDVIVKQGILGQHTHFLPKPFTIEALAQKIREVLDR